MEDEQAATPLPGALLMGLRRHGGWTETIGFSAARACQQAAASFGSRLSSLAIATSFALDLLMLVCTMGQLCPGTTIRHSGFNSGPLGFGLGRVETKFRPCSIDVPQKASQGPTISAVVGACVHRPAGLRHRSEQESNLTPSKPEAEIFAAGAIRGPTSSAAPDLVGIYHMII